MLKKKGVIEFSWIFALIVGAVILFLAFYFIGTKLMESRLVEQKGTEHTLDILLNPFSYFGGLGATSASPIELPKEEKINFSCSTEGNFGYDTILAGNGEPKTVDDKYIFSESYIQGKKFQVISKPFEMPWRVADVIYLIDGNKVYCFVNMPDTKKEFGEEGMNISNFQFDSCDPDAIKICKGSGVNCDITVYDNYVSKGQRMYFVDDATMYAAIFSEPRIYECNLKRLAKRLSYQVDVYKGKMLLLNSRPGCSVSVNLDALKTKAQSIASSVDLANLKQEADSVSSQNSGYCRLF